MAFPMMPTAQWDVVRKMGPDELNKAAMGEYQAQGISPVFALARIKEETALAAAFQAQEQKQQQEEQAKMEGVPVEDIPFTVAEGMLRERGITGVDPSVDREMPPEQMAALQGGIAGGQPMGMEGPPVGMEGPPPMMEGQPPGMGGQPPMMAYGGGLIPRMAYGGLISDSRAYQQGGQIQDPLDAQGFMDLFGFSPTDDELAEYNASLDTDSLSVRMQPGTAPPPVASPDSAVALPPTVAPSSPADTVIDPYADPMETVDPGVPSTQVSQGEAQRLAGVEGRLAEAQSGLTTMQTLNPETAREWDEKRENVAALQRHGAHPSLRHPQEISDKNPFLLPYKPLEKLEREIGWMENPKSEEELRGNLSRAYGAFLEDSSGFRTEAPTQGELMNDPNYRLAAENLTVLGYEIPDWAEQLEGTVGVPEDEVGQQATDDIIAEGGAVYAPTSEWGSMEPHVDEFFDVAEGIRTRQGIYDEGEREVDRRTLARSRKDIEDLVQLDRMWKQGKITELEFIEAKDAIRGQYEVGVFERTSELLDERDEEGRFAESEIGNLAADLAFRQGRAEIDEANFVRNQAARVKEDIEHVGRLTSAQEVAATTSEDFITDVEAALSGRGERTTAQQASLQDVQDRRTILSAEQLEGHKALAADQDKAIRKQAGFAADSTLFGGVGDVLRGDPRNQRFAGVIGDVNVIRGGELEDLMGVQTNLLEKTTAIQDELIAGEKQTLQDIYGVGLEFTVAGEEAIRDKDKSRRDLQDSLEQMNIGIGASREGVLAGAESAAAGIRDIYGDLGDSREAATAAAANFRARVLDKNQTTSEQIYEMSTKLLDLKSLSLEERRTIQAAINSGQMDALRQLLAKHADYDRAENAIVTREAGRVDAADTQWLDTVAPLTSDLARSAATLRGQQGTDAANQRVTRENQLGSIEAWEALEKSQQHTIRDISNRDYQKDANGVVVRGPQAAAEMKGNALANAKQQYSNILRQRWGFLIRQGHELEGQEDPEVVQTVTSRLVRAGMRPGQSPQAFIDEQKSEVQEAMQQQGVDNAEALSGVLRESRSILERPSGIRSINIPEVGQGWGGEPLLEPERRLRQLSRPGSGRNPWSSGG